MSIAYRPDIDGLRAVAVVSVIGFHAFPSWISGGFVGVDVFFVISGFLISSILLEEAQGAGISLWAFYGRRIIRIFPALVLVLAACFFGGWYTLFASEYKQLGKHMVAGATFFSNIVLWMEAGYFDKASETKPLLHLWSLGIEEQFYIFWPILLMGLLKLRRCVIAIALTALFVSLAFACYMVFEDRTQAFYSPLLRAWELLAGALLALVQRTKPALGERLQHPALSWTGGVLILLGVSALSPTNPFPGPLALLPVVGTFLLIAASPSGWVNRKVLAHPMLVNIGLISYPLYMWHWPLLSFANLMDGGQPAMGMRVAIVAVTFVLAWLTYQWVEKPVRKLNKRVAIGILVALMAVLGVLGKNIYDRDGLERIRHKKIIVLEPQVKQDFLEWEETGLIPKTPCATPFQFPGSVACLTTHPERMPTAAVIGDSHAFHAYWGLSRALDGVGENLVLLGRGACVPFAGHKRGNDSDRCQPHMDETLSWVEKNAAIKKVFFIFRGRYLPNQSSLAAQELFQNSMERTLQQMLQAGKKVYVFLPVSEPGFDPRLCVGGLPFGRKAPLSCDISRSHDLAQRLDLMRLMEAVLKRHPSVKVLDPSAYLCEGDVCPLIRNGKSVFKDENHLSYSGSLLLGQKMLDAGVLK